MKFRELIKDSIIKLLVDNSKNCFSVAGHQKQNKSASLSLGDLRIVTVFFSEGDFPKKAAGISGTVQHDITYRIELTVSSAAQADLKTLNNPNANSSELVSALDGIREAGLVADASIDELADLVYQIIMDSKNLDLGLPLGTISNRWIERIQKDQPEERGELLVLTCSMFLTLRTEEDIVGVPTEAGEFLANKIDLEDDDNEQTGVKVNF